MTTGPIAAGMLMVSSLNGREWAVGIVFAVLVPGLVTAAFRMGWDVSYQGLTENRASQIENALKRFHKRQGR